MNIRIVFLSIFCLSTGEYMHARLTESVASDSLNYISENYSFLDAQGKPSPGYTTRLLWIVLYFGGCA